MPDFPKSSPHFSRLEINTKRLCIFFFNFFFTPWEDLLNNLLAGNEDGEILLAVENHSNQHLIRKLALCLG